MGGVGVRHNDLGHEFDIESTEVSVAETSKQTNKRTNGRMNEQTTKRTRTWRKSHRRTRAHRVDEHNIGDVRFPEKGRETRDVPLTNPPD